MKRIFLAFSAACMMFMTHSVAQTKPAKHFIVYLPFYRPRDMAAALAATNLTGVTDMDIAFVGPPLCSGLCTAASDFTISADSHTDADVDAVVQLAHAKGISVLASIGGGGGGVSEIAQFYNAGLSALLVAALKKYVRLHKLAQFYNAGLSALLVAALKKYVRLHKLDGIDSDIEISDNMGAPYADFIAKLITAMHSEGKIVSCATDKYIQASMPQATLLSFDYISLMVYSNLKDAQDSLNFFVNVKQVPASKVVLGVGFYGEARNGADADYADILTAYPNAYRVDTVGGGTFKDGIVLNYIGEDTTAKEAELASQYGGIMVWQLLGDAPPPHSLLNVIRANFK
jgi:chitinase